MKQRAKCRIFLCQLEHCYIIIPVTPLLTGDVPVLPERDQCCSVPLKKIVPMT